KNTCSGEQGMTLAQSKSTCSVRTKWLPRFRLLLAAGVTPDDIHAYYVAENNVVMQPARPWLPHELKIGEEDAVSFGLPAALVGVVLVGLAVFAYWNRKRRRAAQRGGDAPADATREARGEQAPALSGADRALLL